MTNRLVLYPLKILFCSKMQDQIVPVKILLILNSTKIMSIKILVFDNETESESMQPTVRITYHSSNSLQSC